MIETPWWSNLVTAIIASIVSVLAYRYAITPRVGGPPFGFSALFKSTFSYLPHILLLFGILADMFTYEGVYSIPTLIGFLSIFVNWVMRYFWDGMLSLFSRPIAPVDRLGSRAGRPGVISGSIAPPLAGGDRASMYFSDYDGCNVQGFARFSSKYAPQTLVITATIFMYYIIDLIDNRGWKNATAAIVGGSALFGAQASLIEDCEGDVAGSTPGRFVRTLISLTEGTIFAGISYAIVKATSPTSLPSSVVSPFPRKSRRDLSPGPNGTYVDSDGNPYIVLPNGQAFPDVSTPESRKAFAGIAGANLGTGAPVTPSSCSA